MDKKIKEAIELIEQSGGFVMMQGDIDQQEASLTEKQMDALEQEERDAFNNYQERKREAFNRFDKLLGSKNFSFNKVENICFEEGIDMDDIEEYIHGHY